MRRRPWGVRVLPVPRHLAPQSAARSPRGAAERAVPGGASRDLTRHTRRGPRDRARGPRRESETACRVCGLCLWRKDLPPTTFGSLQGLRLNLVES